MTHSYDPADDAALAARAANGDEAAFATLYDRYFGRIYDFVLRIVRDGDAAADATQLAFVRAWQALSGGSGPTTSAKSWLFAIARNAAIDETRRTSRLAPFDGDRETGARPWDVDQSRFANPDAVVRDGELAMLVWRAADSLNPGDYALLDMHVRQELGPEEIAEALAMKPGTVYTRLSRLRDALEEAVGADLLARAGRRECSALNQVLATVEMDNGLDRAARRRVQRHLESCPTCEETRRRLVSPMALFGAFTPLAAPPGLRQDGLDRALRAPRTAAPAVLPPAAERAARKSWLPGAAAAAIVVLVLIAAILLLLRGGDGAALALVDPSDVQSTSHRPGVASNERRIAVAWTRLETADRYSVSWSHEPRGLPDDVADLPGDATGVTSESLGDGEWYFHLRTRNAEGRWTSTVHAGPFVVGSGAVSGVSPVASLDATPIRSPSPSPSALRGASPSPSPAPASATAIPTGAATPPPAATTVPPTST